MGTDRLAPPAATIAPGDVARFLLDAPAGSVTAVGGLDLAGLQGILDEAPTAVAGRRRVLLAPVTWSATAEEIAAAVIDTLAETARRLWPVWFTDVSFAGCPNDAQAQARVGAIVGFAAGRLAGLLPSWAVAAAVLALAGRVPRVPGIPAATEIRQLALAISGCGLVLIVDANALSEPGAAAAAAVRALEWAADHGGLAVVAAFAMLPAAAPPFDRILGRAGQVLPPATAAAAARDAAPTWLAPWRGRPHPLSDIELRLARLLADDAELAPLFAFNEVVETVRGSRPKVDLLWAAGRLVVELDGYGTHGNRAAFIQDRQRDYELALSGYTVLRLANDEIEQDYGKAVDKIRDMVRRRREATA
jgi:hypothetical protein